MWPLRRQGFRCLQTTLLQHPFVCEETSETEQAPVAYPIEAQRLHKLQGQRGKLVNQLVAQEERRKDLHWRLDETVRQEVLAQDELDRALARQRNNTIPDPREVPGLSQQDFAILDETEKQDYLAAVEAAKGLWADLGRRRQELKCIETKSRLRGETKKEEPQQKKHRLAAPDPTAQGTAREQAMEVDGSEEERKASDEYRAKEAAHILQTTRSVEKTVEEAKQARRNMPPEQPTG